MAIKAKESRQIQKARKKIQKQIDAADSKINEKTLAATSELIKRQLARHKSERIDLKTRLVTAFDENRHPAKTESRFVMRLLRQLRQTEESAPDSSLEGRIKNIADPNNEK